jgi:hypothetical protein
MERLCVALSLCVILFLAVPAFGGQEAAIPVVVEGIVRNLDFFARPWVLWGYENCFLHDVNRLNREQIGLSLMSPSGFEVRLVYDVNTLEVIYYDMKMHEKTKREAMRSQSVSVPDAIKLAKNVVNTKN